MEHTAMNHDFSHDLTAYLLDELTPEERAAAERALADSPALREELEGIRKTHAALAELLAGETGPEPVAAATKTLPFPEKAAPSGFRRTLRFLGSPAGFGALAACGVVVAGVALSMDSGPKPILRAELAENHAESSPRLEAASPTHKTDTTAQPENFAEAASTLPTLLAKDVTRPITESGASQVLAASRTAKPASTVHDGSATGIGGGKSTKSTGLNLSSKVAHESESIARGAARPASFAPTPVAEKRKLDSAYRVGSSPETAVFIIAGTPPDYGDGVTYTRRASGSGDRFDAGVTEQDFVTAASAPLSTFSVDVNTASYAYARKVVNDGGMPAPASVRAEEWLNHFAYAYPAPMGAHPISVYAEGSDCPWNTGHKLVRIGLRAKDVATASRPAANLVFLIDTSGSMYAPDRLPLVKESLLKLLSRLEPRDRVGIVTYAGSSGIAAEPTVCDAAGKAALEKVILGLHASGATNGADGLRDAYALATKNLVPNGVNHVILASDGDFNVGLADTNALVEFAKREAAKKVFLTVLGFGTGNLNSDLMKQLSVKADGNHYFIDSLKEADRVLSQKLLGTLVTVARDVKIQVDFNPAKVASYRLIGYDTRRLANEDFNDDAKDAGEMGAGQTVTALYEIVPVGAKPPVDASRYAPKPAEPTTPKPAAAVSDEWLTVKVRYQPPGGGESTLIETPLPATGVVDAAHASPDQRFAAAVAEAALALRRSKHAGSANLESALRAAEAPEVLGDSPERREFADLLRLARHRR